MRRSKGKMFKKCKGSIFSQKLTVPYCQWGSTQTPLSAASVLENNVDPYNTKTFGMARPKIFQQDSWLEEMFYKLPETPCYGISDPMFPQKAVKTYKAYVYLSPRYAVEQEEKITVAELLSGIDSLCRSRKNDEKKEKFSYLSRSLDLPSSSPGPGDIPGFQITHKGKAYRDWRGMVAPIPVKEDDQMSQKHVRLKKIDFQTKKKKCAAPGGKLERKKLSDKCLSLQTQKKLKKNVTHPEISEAVCDSRKHPSNREELKAVICIQRYVRGWLLRRAYKRVKLKSASHGLSLLAAVKCYRNMMARIKRRAGVLDLSTPLHYFELEEWMDKKKFYEAMFSKRVFGQKMDRGHLPEFFRDCGYFIPASGVQRIFQLVFPASATAVRNIKKHQAVEMAFTLFPPLGAKVKNVITVPLPWLHPLMDGRGGSKKSVFSHQKSKKPDFQVSAALVTSSIREQKETHLSDQK
ncbi:IQ domain-containing protein M isoform X3 [Gallus gallus]|uniref:IQ domain-containing protein M isoform X3 n=1 Tax=Gallus gallus TaxID=9031 RepID=UPI001AE926D0|nr:IQ domain-containing protein M isoform X3 [Gallus gallus]